MSEEQKQPSVADLEQIRDLFARAHDYIAQATYPGHMGMKIAEVLNFLAFQHQDFKQRAEKLSALEAAAAKAASIVDVATAKETIAEVLGESETSK